MSSKRRARGEVTGRPAPGPPAGAHDAAAAAAGPGRDFPAHPRVRRVQLALLVTAALAVVGFYASARVAAPAPWSYDEYYHVGVARELVAHFPLRSFPWTPFSILSDHFADKEPLFHLLLLPFARLPIETAGLAGVLICQLFLVAAFAWVIWRLRAPHAYAFVLGLTLLGSMFAMRVDMCRPHLLLMAFSVLVVGLLVTSPAGREAPARGARRISTVALVVVSALFSLAHSGAWIAIFYAAAWAFAGWLVPAGPASRFARRELPGEPGERGGHPERGDLPENPETPGHGRGGFLWLPLAATAGGWLLGQLIHPNMPYNLRLVALVNLVVPFEASPAGNAALRSQIGEELTPPGLAILAEQWTVFLAPLLAAALLLRRPRLRTRATLAAAFIALSFLLAGSIFLRRMLELAAPLGLLALAVVVAEAAKQRSQEEVELLAVPAKDAKEPKRTVRQGPAPGAFGATGAPGTPGRPGRLDTHGNRQERRRRAAAGAFSGPLLAGWGPWIVPFVLAIGAFWTAYTVRSYGFGRASAPQQMALWLGAHGQRGERVFTAQWADSAPLFYSAPQLQSLVALDPTLFYAKDPARFQEYVDVALGRHADPAAAIRRDFGARWVTVSLMPDYRALALQLVTPPAAAGSAGAHPASPAQIVYRDPYYVILDLGRR